MFDRWGSDDMFYYSQIAGNIVVNHIVSFDGIHPTNGFQPLFLCLLLPLGEFLLNDLWFSYFAVLIFCSVLILLAAYCIYTIFRDMDSPGLGNLAALVMVAHPKILSVTFNGTEAALSLLLLCFTIRQLTRDTDKIKIPLLSVSLTLLILTRFDLVFLMPLIFLYLWILDFGFRKNLYVFVLPGIVFISWLLFNYLTFKSIIPNSGETKHIHGKVYEAHFFSDLLGLLHTLVMSESRWSMVMVLLLPAGIYQIFKSFDSRFFLLIVLLSAGGLLSNLVAIYKLNGFRDWYLMPLFLVTVILTAYGLTWWSQQLKKMQWLLVILIPVIWIEAQYTARKMDGNKVIAICENWKSSIPESATIGSFNAGIVNTWFADRNRVVNLDGVVNASVIEAFRQQSLNDYCISRGIQYILDIDGSIRFNFDAFGDMKGLELLDNNGRYALYSVQ